MLEHRTIKLFALIPTLSLSLYTPTTLLALSLRTYISPFLLLPLCVSVCMLSIHSYMTFGNSTLWVLCSMQNEGKKLPSCCCFSSHMIVYTKRIHIHCDNCTKCVFYFPRSIDSNPKFIICSIEMDPMTKKFPTLMCQ